MNVRVEELILYRTGDTPLPTRPEPEPVQGEPRIELLDPDVDPNDMVPLPPHRPGQRGRRGRRTSRYGY
jgi:hypothetical protein